MARHHEEGNILNKTLLKSLYKIEIKTKLLEPMVLATSDIDSNLTSTFQYVPASMIMGIFANEYIKKKTLYKSAHVDEDFYEWFLKGDVLFTNAWLTDGQGQFLPTPLCLQIEKGKHDKAYNLALEAERPPKSHKQTRTIGGFTNIPDAGKIVVTKKNPETVIYFHNQRDGRISGKSTEGKIFYYEALREGQEFVSCILGKKETLEAFNKCFSEPFDCRCGRSKTAQYGMVEITVKAPEPYEVETGKGKPCETHRPETESSAFNRPFPIVFASPAIFYNDFGFPDTSTQIFKS